MGFEVGRLIARIQLEGQEQAEAALRRLRGELDGTGSAAKKAGTDSQAAGAGIDKAGSAADGAAGKADKAKKSLSGMGDAASDAADDLDDAAKAAQQAAEDAEDLGDATEEAGKAAVGWSKETQQAATEVGTAMLGVGAGITALVGLAVTKYASFDEAMSEVRATIRGTADEHRALEQAAIEQGAATVYTAEEAAAAQTELAKAGVGVNDILGGGLVGSLSLAAAGQIEVADAAEVAATAMTQFRLSGDKIPHLADLLAAGAGKAQGGVQDLAYALKQSGLVASQMGISVEDTIGTLSAFASAGLLGSDAGTSFRTMLLSLANPSTKAQKVLEGYNIQAYDAQGNFVGMTKLAGQLQEKLGTLTQAERDKALATIFGSDAIRAANVLYNQGAKGIEEWNAAVNDSGYASQQAADLTDNLAGDVERLGGAFDTALIIAGAGANGILRDMVQTLEGVVDGYGRLPSEVQQGVLAFGLLTGAVLLAGGAFLVGVPKIIAFRAALATLNASFPGVQANLTGIARFLTGPWGIALAAAAVSIFVLQKAVDNMKAPQEELEASLASTTRTAETMFATFAQGKGGLTDLAVPMERLNEAIYAIDSSKNPFAFFLDDELSRVYRTLQDVGTELGKVAETDLSGASESFGMFVAQTDGSDESILRLLNSMDGYRYALIAAATENGTYSATMSEAEQNQALLDLAMSSAADSAEYVASAYDSAEFEAQDLTLTIDELVDAFDKANGVQLTAEERAIKYADMLAKLDEQVAKNTGGIGLSTEEGRKNRQMLLDSAKAAQDMAKANLDAGGSVEDYRSELVGSRDTLIENAMRLGATADEAKDLADRIFQIPSQKEIRISANTQEAQRVINGFITGNDGRRIRVVVDSVGGSTYQVQGTSVRYNANGSVTEYYAGGGIRENHTAQIARAGAMRVWAEPETGGEAYIPLADSKRDASEVILGQVADRFGYSLVPRGATTMRASGDGVSESRVVNNFYGPVGSQAEEIVRRQENAERRANMKAGYSRVGGAK